MKIAIIYTGELRTIKSTIKYLKDFLDKNTYINNITLDVFSVLQIGNEIDEYEKFIIKNIGKYLKSLEWFVKNSINWTNLRENLLQKIPIENNWIEYLRNSGSMIEYYQMYLAYKSIENYEKLNNINYDLIIRYRTDLVLKDDLDLALFSKINTEKIRNLLVEIMEYKKTANIFSPENVEILMNTFFCRRRLYYNSNLVTNRIYSEEYNKIFENIESISETKFIERIKDYILNKNYIITLRVNLFYIIKRELMSIVSDLGINYGKYRIPNDDYWFNAENQLKGICLENKIDMFDCRTNLEEKCLYQYDPKNYFVFVNNDQNNEEINNEKLIKHGEFSFFIKRR